MFSSVFWTRDFWKRKTISGKMNQKMNFQSELMRLIMTIVTEMMSHREIRKTTWHKTDMRPRDSKKNCPKIRNLDFRWAQDPGNDPRHRRKNHEDDQEVGPGNNTQYRLISAEHLSLIHYYFMFSFLLETAYPNISQGFIIICDSWG